MANPEHVRVLLQGVEVWNNWLAGQRVNDSRFRPDLSRFDVWCPEAQESALFVAINNSLTGDDSFMAASDSSERLDINIKNFIKSKYWCLLPDMRGVLLSGVDLQGANFTGADLRYAHFEDSNLGWTHFEGANVSLAHFEGAFLLHSSFNFAEISSSHFENSFIQYGSFKKANLSFVRFNNSDLSFVDFKDGWLDSADFTSARLFSACFDNSHLMFANFKKSFLYLASLVNANLVSANFIMADIRFANLSRANVSEISYDRWGKYKGIRLDGVVGSQKFIRHANDQYYIEELRGEAGDFRPWKWNWGFWKKGRWGKEKFTGISWRYLLIYLPWLISCDCGRSLLLWATWSILMACGFAWKFLSLGEAGFRYTSELGWGFQTALYYSVVTFTTLGFGDVIPKTHEAVRWVMAEVIVGYVMLGGLISIFANKLARRSG